MLPICDFKFFHFGVLSIEFWVGSNHETRLRNVITSVSVVSVADTPFFKTHRCYSWSNSTVACVVFRFPTFILD